MKLLMRKDSSGSLFLLCCIDLKVTKLCESVPTVIGKNQIYRPAVSPKYFKKNQSIEACTSWIRKTSQNCIKNAQNSHPGKSQRDSDHLLWQINACRIPDLAETVQAKLISRQRKIDIKPNKFNNKGKLRKTLGILKPAGESSSLSKGNDSCVVQAAVQTQLSDGVSKLQTSNTNRPCHASYSKCFDYVRRDGNKFCKNSRPYSGSDMGETSKERCGETKFEDKRQTFLLIDSTTDFREWGDKPRPRLQKQGNSEWKRSPAHGRHCDLPLQF